MRDSRYSRQIVYENIGENGQRKLGESSVVMIGLGALGTVSANNLTRAGVGRIRLIDRDYVEFSNLQRQTLYDEEDVKNEKPKAIAAFDHLSKANSSITLEPVISDVNSSNIEQYIEGIDLVLDCTDNFEIRLLINEACDQLGIPWIYCGALGSSCMTMNILPGKTPCFACLSGNSTPDAGNHTCSTVGVLNMATAVAASIQSAEALKILTGSSDVRETLFFMDVWDNAAEYLEIKKNPECPVCASHHYAHLDQPGGTNAVSLCGRNEIQITPGRQIAVDFEALVRSLSRLGNVSYNAFMLKYNGADGIGIRLFKDGRAIIENARDVNQAKSIYAEFFGL